MLHTQTRTRGVSGTMAQYSVAPKVLLNGVLAEHIAEEHLNAVAQQVFGRSIEATNWNKGKINRAAQGSVLL